jgi:hypothetical protein
MREGKRASYFSRRETTRVAPVEDESDPAHRSGGKPKVMFSEKTKRRKKHSASKNPQKMASETTATTALSPTVVNRKAVDTKQQQHFKLTEVPAPQQITDESTDTGTDHDQDDFAIMDEQDENVNLDLTLASSDHNYVSDNDPYIYSDDSESFSDAYFRPQISDYPAVLYPRSTSHGSTTSRDDHIGRRVAAEEGLLGTTPPLSSSPHALNYGTLASGQPTFDRSGSPFKMPGNGIASILEDYPADEEQQQLIGSESQYSQQYYGGYQATPTASYADYDAHYLRQSKKERRRLRKQQKAAARQRQMHMLQNQKQREHAVREKTVSEVKGRPQDETLCRDSVYAYIFVAQLVFLRNYNVLQGRQWLGHVDKTWPRQFSKRKSKRNPSAEKQKLKALTCKHCTGNLR